MTSRKQTWGLVNAEPHEFLIHIRNGTVRRAQQGGGCWIWPSDTVARVDTSVRRLQFTADQVTQEKVGVAVTGLAVFRIVSPLLAYRTLNLSEGEVYQEILEQMFVGATRRLVANLSLEECMSRRKDALAEELLHEVAPVVEGRGRSEDGTDRGWGIAIDTIEIQDVRVLSQEVFANLQAPYREALELEALKFHADVEAESQRIAADQARAREEVLDLRAEAERARRQAEAELRVVIAGRDAESRRVEGEARADVIALKRKARAADASPERLQEIMLTETLPRVAEAFRDSYDRVVISGGEHDFLGQGLAQVLAVAQAFGIELPSGGG